MNISKIKKKLLLLNKIQRLTFTVKQISNSKFIQIQKKYLDYLKYKNKFNLFFSEFSFLILSPKKRESTKILHIIFSGEQGLVGNYHISLFQNFLENIKNQKKRAILFLIGEQAYNFFKKNSCLFQIVNQKPFFTCNFYNNLEQFKKYIIYIIDLIKNKIIDQIVLNYNVFINKNKYCFQQKIIWPLTFNRLQKQKKIKFFQNHKILQDKIIFSYFYNIIYGIILNASLSECSARMVKMQQITDNAETQQKKLFFQYNKIRKQLVTNSFLINNFYSKGYK